MGSQAIQEITERIDKGYKKFFRHENKRHIFIEDLNLKAMQMLWGRKVSDVAYRNFINILAYKSNVVKIGRFYPSSKACSVCGNTNLDLKLSDRMWTCPVCNTMHDRDENAAENIYTEGLRVLREGTSSLGVGLSKTDYVRICR